MIDFAAMMASPSIGKYFGAHVRNCPHTICVIVDLLNSTPEPDGSTKRYQLRVDPNAYGGRASRDCLAAAASTWRMADGSLAFKKPEQYSPAFES